MKLLTRRQIIKQWEKQEDKILDSFCCPNCRDILSYRKEDNKFICINPACGFSGIDANDVSGMEDGFKIMFGGGKHGL
jgi:ribosomal protein L37AE/L43A